MAPTTHSNLPRRQRGVVLFIALIAMVVLSLAGVALIRAVDTTGSVAGNIAFREAAAAATNLSLEKAVYSLFLSAVADPAHIDPEFDNAANRYYYRLQLGEKPNGVPALLDGTYATVKAAYTSALGAPDIYPTTKAEVRLVIERVCDPASPAPPLTVPLKLQYCDQLAPKMSLGKTSMKLIGPTLQPFPLYRATVRVDLPGTNSTAYAQAMFR